MMSLTTLTLIALGLYLAMMIGIGLWAGRSQDYEGFVIGNRQVGLIPFAASYGAGIRDVAYIWFWITLAFLYGYAPLMFAAAYLVSSCGVALVAPKVRRWAREHNYVTFGRMIGDRIGPVSRYALSLFILGLSMGFAAANVFVLGQILSTTLDLASTLTIPMTTLIVLFYLWMGGYATVIRTDLFQYAVILFILCLPFFMPLSSDVLTDWQSLGALGWTETAGLMAIAVLGPFATGDLWQRIYSARDDRAARFGPLLGYGFFLVLSLGLMFMGFSARLSMPEADPDQLFYLFFENRMLPDFVLGGLLVVLVAMGMSTLDTHTYLFTSIVMRDFVKTSTQENRTAYIRLSRLVMLVMLACVTLLALNFTDLVQLLMAFIGAFVVGAPLFFCATVLALPRTRMLDFGLAGAMAAGLGVFAFLQVSGAGQGSFVYAALPGGVTALLSACVAIVCKFRPLTQA